MTPAYKEQPPANFKEAGNWKPAQPGDTNLPGKWWRIFRRSSVKRARRTDRSCKILSLKIADARFRQARRYASTGPRSILRSQLIRLSALFAVPPIAPTLIRRWRNHRLFSYFPSISYESIWDASVHDFRRHGGSGGNRGDLAQFESRFRTRSMILGAGLMAQRQILNNTVAAQTVDALRLTTNRDGGRCRCQAGSGVSANAARHGARRSN